MDLREVTLLDRTCLRCENPLPVWKRSDAKFCSDRCRAVPGENGSTEAKARWRSRNRDRHNTTNRQWRLDNPDKVRAMKRQHEAARKARKLDQFVENFTVEQVLDSYGSECHLCREPIDLILKFPNPGSLQVDHVIPLARGGEHSLANVKPSHMRCNGSRHMRLVEEWNAR